MNAAQGQKKDEMKMAKIAAALVLAALAVPMLLGEVSLASPLDLNCGDVTNRGFANMPEMSHYFPQPLPGALALSSSPINLDSFVFAQCFLEPRLTVKQAIRLLIFKAAHGQPLPDIPQGGA
jgi:hypothetical protein